MATPQDKMEKQLRREEEKQIKSRLKSLGYGLRKDCVFTFFERNKFSRGIGVAVVDRRNGQEGPCARSLLDAIEAVRDEGWQVPSMKP